MPHWIEIVAEANLATFSILKRIEPLATLRWQGRIIFPLSLSVSSSGSTTLHRLDSAAIRKS